VCQLHSDQTGSEARPASCLMGTCGSFAGEKRPGREINHSSLFIVQAKNSGAMLQLSHVSSLPGA
jgi:hypothetical protein